MGKTKNKVRSQKVTIAQRVMPFVGWALAIWVFFFRPKWFAVAILGYSVALLLTVFGAFVFMKAKEAKEERGWLYAILTAIGFILFLGVWYFITAHMDKRHLP